MIPTAFSILEQISLHPYNLRSFKTRTGTTANRIPVNLPTLHSATYTPHIYLVSWAQHFPSLQPLKFATDSAISLYTQNTVALMKPSNSLGETTTVQQPARMMSIPTPTQHLLPVQPMQRNQLLSEVGNRTNTVCSSSRFYMTYVWPWVFSRDAWRQSVKMRFLP